MGRGVKASSSSRAAQRVGAGFVGFDALSGAGFVPASGDAGAGLGEVPPRIKVLLAHLGKPARRPLQGAAVTKCKALAELNATACDGEDEVVESELVPMLPHWPRLYGRLAWDPDRRVRAAAHGVMGAVGARVKKRLLPHLKGVVPPLVMALHDSTSREVTTAASRALDTLFPDDAKRRKMLDFTRDAVLARVRAVLLEHTAETLGELASTPGDAHEKQLRLEWATAAALAVAADLLKLHDRTACPALPAAVSELLGAARVWKMASPKHQPSVAARVAVLDFAAAAAEHAPAVFTALGDPSRPVVRSGWAAGLQLVLHAPAFWQALDPRKAVWPHVWTALRCTGGADPEAAFAVLPRFVAAVPPEVLGEGAGFGTTLFRELATGCAAESADPTALAHALAGSVSVAMALLERPGVDATTWGIAAAHATHVPFEATPTTAARALAALAEGAARLHEGEAAEALWTEIAAACDGALISLRCDPGAARGGAAALLPFLAALAAALHADGTSPHRHRGVELAVRLSSSVLTPPPGAALDAVLLEAWGHVMLQYAGMGLFGAEPQGVGTPDHVLEATLLPRLENCEGDHNFAAPGLHCCLAAVAAAVSGDDADGAPALMANLRAACVRRGTSAVVALLDACSALVPRVPSPLDAQGAAAVQALLLDALGRPAESGDLPGLRALATAVCGAAGPNGALALVEASLMSPGAPPDPELVAGALAAASQGGCTGEATALMRRLFGRGSEPSCREAWLLASRRCPDLVSPAELAATADELGACRADGSVAAVLRAPMAAAESASLLMAAGADCDAVWSAILPAPCVWVAWRRAYAARDIAAVPSFADLGAPVALALASSPRAVVCVDGTDAAGWMPHLEVLAAWAAAPVGTTGASRALFEMSWALAVGAAPSLTPALEQAVERLAALPGAAAAAIDHAVQAGAEAGVEGTCALLALQRIAGGAQMQPDAVGALSGALAESLAAISEDLAPPSACRCAVAEVLLSIGASVDPKQAVAVVHRASAQLLGGSDAAMLKTVAGAALPALATALVAKLVHGEGGTTGEKGAAAAAERRQAVPHVALAFELLEAVAAAHAADPELLLADADALEEAEDCRGSVLLCTAVATLLAVVPQVEHGAPRALKAAEWDLLLCTGLGWLETPMTGWAEGVLLGKACRVLGAAGRRLGSASPTGEAAAALADWRGFFVPSVAEIALPLLFEGGATLGLDPAAALATAELRAALAEAAALAPDAAVAAQVTPELVVPMMAGPCAAVRAAAFGLAARGVVLSADKVAPPPENDECKAGAELEAGMAPSARMLALAARLDSSPASERAMLLCGLLVCRHFRAATAVARSSLAAQLRASGLGSRLLDAAADLAVAAPASSVPVALGQGFEPCGLCSLEQLGACTLRDLLIAVPAEARVWYGGLSRNGRHEVEKFVSAHVTPALIRAEFAGVGRAAAGDEHLSLVARPKAREVAATYTMEGTSVELVVALSNAHPLLPMEVRADRIHGVPERQTRAWTLQMLSFLRNQNGSVLDAVLIWKRNIDKRFEGLEDCGICYSVIHDSRFSLPDKKCKTCNHVFHGACLYKWFSTSQQSTCPLCRNLWMH